MTPALDGKGQKEKGQRSSHHRREGTAVTIGCLASRGGRVEVSEKLSYDFLGLWKVQDAFNLQPLYLVYLISNGILGAGIILHEGTNI